MTDLDLVRQLKQLHRALLMFETDLRPGHLDEDLVATMERQVDVILSDDRCNALRDRYDALRESTLTPRHEMMRDTVRACEQLKDLINAMAAELG